MRREDLKQEIDKKAQEFINKINEYEKECTSFIQLDSTSIDEKIYEWENDLEKSQQFLKTLKRNAKKWNSISNKMFSNLKDIQSELVTLNEKQYFT